MKPIFCEGIAYSAADLAGTGEMQAMQPTVAPAGAGVHH